MSFKIQIVEFRDPKVEFSFYSLEKFEKMITNKHFFSNSCYFSNIKPTKKINTKIGDTMIFYKIFQKNQ